MRTVDHRFALSRPALLSAPDKKSFSSVSSPIFACSSFRSTGGTASVAGPDPKTPAAPSCSCAFQAVIWPGCTSNSLANSASVFSPLIAASATFALKAPLCVRRVRFVILAPDPRQLRRCQAGNPLIGEPLAELRGRVNFGLIGSGFRETSYPVCGTSAASAYSHCKNAEGTDDVSQRDTFHILGSPASGASALQQF